MSRLLTLPVIGAALVLLLASGGALGWLWLRDGRFAPAGIIFALLPFALLLWGVLACGGSRLQIGINTWAITMFGALVPAVYVMQSGPDNWFGHLAARSQRESDTRLRLYVDCRSVTQLEVDIIDILHRFETCLENCVMRDRRQSGLRVAHMAGDYIGAHTRLIASPRRYRRTGARFFSHTARYTGSA